VDAEEGVLFRAFMGYAAEVVEDGGGQAE
jgi:hypothetical protein